MEAQETNGFTANIGGRWPKHFSDLTAVANWLQSEQTAWQWLSRTGTTGSQAWSRMRAAWNAVQGQLQRLRQQPDAPMNPILEALQNSAIVPTDSDYATRVAALKEEDEKAAVAWLAIRIGSGIDATELAQHQGTIRGAVLAILDKEKLTPESITATVSSFDQTAEEICNELAGIQSMRDTARADMDAFEQEIQESRLSFGQEFRERLAAFSEEHRKVLNTTSEDWETLRGTYDEQLSLRAPVEYWRRRQNEHGRKAIMFGWATGLVLFAALAAMVWLAALLVLPDLLRVLPFSAELADVIARREEAELGHQVGRVAVFALLATPFLWGIRMLARNLVSQSHLNAEAGERVTMAETYLALLRDEAMKPEDRAIMLYALFRPMRTGLVKEDLPPAGLLDATLNPPTGR